MDKRMLNLIIGVGLAVIAIVFIHRQMQQREALIRRLIEEGKLMEFVVAKTDIPKESTLTFDMVGIKRGRSNAYQPGDLASLDSAVGRFVEVDILEGQHINSSMLRAIGSIKFLSQGVPKGMRAMTIPVDKISAIEGLMKPSDRVDIISTFKIPTGQRGQNMPVVVTLFEGVKILASGKSLSPYNINTAADTITVALKPEDIKLLTYVLEVGNKIRFVLRAPLDKGIDTSYKAVTMDTLMKRLGMWAPPPAIEEKPTVDVYKGAIKEEFTVDKP